MLNWLRNVWNDITGGVPALISYIVNTIIAGICWVLDFIFGNVGAAWSELVGAVNTLRSSLDVFGAAVWGQLEKIVTYYIPHYAMTAWWWVTNTDSLALVMLWHLLKWLEHYAWTAARFLGEFGLALMLSNLRRFALLLETIVTAVI